MRTWGLALTAAASTLAMVAPANADDATFDGLAATAQRLTTADLQGAAWALTATCAEGDGPDQRLCKAVRDRRAASLRAGTYLVDAERGAFQVGAWDPDAQASLIELRGCIACAAPLGGLYIVSSKVPPSFAGDVATAASLHQGVRSFTNPQLAERWAAVAADARAQFIVRLGGDHAGLAELDGHRVLGVEVLGFRVHQPCDGAIVCASPKAAAVTPDPSTCGKVIEDVPVKVDPTANLPATLTPEDLKAAMKPVTAAARACFDDYGVPGKAKLIYTVSGAGAITAYEHTGDFVDTPTGRCIDKAAKAVTFPAVKKASFTFTYPINVQ